LPNILRCLLPGSGKIHGPTGVFALVKIIINSPILPSNFFLFKIKSIILFLILLKVRPAYHKLDAPNNLFKAIRQS
ncbi:hypothetical protein, partial [Methanobacterium formicicum]|uniref:hypothetical protein n=1 Tax=Methanobacterium formicicum TaxID=2162 RepID=UPI0024935B65